MFDLFNAFQSFLEYTRSLPVDQVNGAFEIIGAFVCATNIPRIRRDKKVEGFNPSTQTFFTVWGLWNLIYYPALGQSWSFWGAVAIVSVNLTWLMHVWYYSRQTKKAKHVRDKYKGRVVRPMKEKYPSADYLPTIETSNSDKFRILGNKITPTSEVDNRFKP